ncbi:MAG TPA: glutathione S-transferase family protein [Solirubrobacterales bacterium]|jgi:glutathione S-transferase|nr:glutathione S-transferase family protein [Solirubrobacterales bacterium]
MTTQTQEKPTLWQIDISHYAEKARWALEYKGVDHVRRSILPGTHIPIALILTRGAQPTVPVLQLDGRNIGDSTEIIAALEARYPEPPLYPLDAEERARAIELEEWFDENLGPHSRLLPFYELIQEPEMFAEVAAESVPGPLGKAKPVVGAYARAYTSIRWNANSEEDAVRAREAIVAAFDKLEAELEKGDGEFLVGDHLSVADVTAASLFYPVVVPPEGPLDPDLPRPPALDRFRQGLSERRGYRWVQDTFSKHRHRS